MDTKTERKAQKQVNNDLAKIGNYHDGIPISLIDSVLERHGFNGMEPAIYCGREGNFIEKVGDKTFLSVTWYKMESGKYEIVSYVS